MVIGKARHVYRNSNDNLYVRYLKWDNLHFNWNYKWLNNNFNANEPAALLATLFVSPLI